MGTKMRGDMLPMEHDIYLHYLYLAEQKTSSGEWTRNTPIATKAECITADIQAIWEISGIPHTLDTWTGKRRVVRLLRKIVKLKKLKMDTKENQFKEDLFDIAECQHLELNCCCSPDKRVPETRRRFLADQRGERQHQGVLSTKSISLRAGTCQQKEIQENKEQALIMLEKEEEVRRKKQKCADDVETEFSQDISIDTMEDNENDSEYEDIEEEKVEKKKKMKTQQNRIELKHLSRAADRFCVSDQAAADIGNGLLKDLGLMTKENTNLLIDHSKLW